MLKRVLPILCVTATAVLIGCGGGAGNTNTATNTNANRAATNAASPANTAASNGAAATTAPGEKIGVAECDDFLAKYEACVSGKVPAQARAQFESGMKQWRESWRKLAANPQTKTTLAGVCKTSLEQTRTSMKAYGCEF
jgi:hypothetical protein